MIYTYTYIYIASKPRTILTHPPNQTHTQARHTQLQNEEREVSWERGSVADLRRGCTFHKLPYLKASCV